MKLNFLLLLACAVLFAVSLFIGAGDVSAADTLKGYIGTGDPLIVLVMQELRLPRALLAVMIGLALGLAGAAMQGFLRNPLADPGIIGTSSFAALGAVLSLQTGLAAAFAAALPLAALAGALLSVGLLLLLSGPGARTETLILSGVALSGFAGAMVSFVLNIADNPYAANEIVFWLMGSLSDRSFRHVGLALPILCLGAVLTFSAARGLNFLSLGEDTAQSMGVDLKRTRLKLILGCACLSGGATAVAGMIGFVGLLVPHLLRPLTGGLPARLLLPSALGGAALILASDIAVRLLAPTSDMKIGVLTAMLGTPVFLHLIWKSRGRSQ